MLGLAEMTEVVAIHFLHLFPIHGLFVDQIYLKWGGPFPAICNYVVIALGTVQYMLISVCSLNRFFVILGSTGARKEFYDKFTWILTLVLTSISALVYSPIFFATGSKYVDYRNNSTKLEDMIVVCTCKISNKDLENFNEIFLLVAKSSNVLFALAVYSCIFLMSCFAKKSTTNKETSKNRVREAKLAVAVFIHAGLAGMSTFLLIGIFYIWPQYYAELLYPIYVLEDISRMFSPILLFVFSRPLRVAFTQTYLSYIPVFKMKTSSIMVLKVSKIKILNSNMNHSRF